jgi:hypothetical protein
MVPWDFSQDTSLAVALIAISICAFAVVFVWRRSTLRRLHRQAGPEKSSRRDEREGEQAS